MKKQYKFNTAQKLKITFGVIAFVIFIVLEAYFVCFSNGISNQTANWELFIQICSWVTISWLTMINIWIFYRLTMAVSETERDRFVESKLSRTESAMLELRVKDYSTLRQAGAKLKEALMSGQNINEYYENFYRILDTMQNSILYASQDKVQNSQIAAVFKQFVTAFKYKNSALDLIDQINRCVRTVEILIFTCQLRDERILRSLRRHPYRYDPTIVSADRYLMQLTKSYYHND